MGDPGEGRGTLGPNAPPPSGGWKPRGPLPDRPRSILVVMMSAVGDAVQVLPVVNALRRTFPETHITWVLQPGPHSLVLGHRAVDELVLFRRVRGSGREDGPGWGATAAFSETLGRLREVAAARPDGRFDLLLALQVYFKAGLITALTSARVKLGFDRARARDLNWLFTTHRIPPNPSGAAHIQDQYFEFLRHMGVDPEPLEYGLETSAQERESRRRFFEGLDRPACAVILATSDPRKNWSPRGYAQVLEGLREDFGLQPVLVGGVSPTETSMARAFPARLRDKIVDARQNDLRRLLWLLEGSTLVISPDTGPLHMARALEVPVVGLFGFTNPKRSGPYRLFQELVVDGYARFPGEEYGVSTERRPGGMERITAAMVLEKVDLALRPPPPPSPAPGWPPEGPPGTSPPRR